MVDAQLAQSRIERGDDDARLERDAGLALKHEIMLDDHGRIGKGPVRIARGERMVETEIGIFRGVKDRRISHPGGIDRGDRGQLFPRDRDQFERVLSQRPRGGHHRNHRLTLPAGLAARERILRRRAVAGQRREPRLPRLADRCEIVARHDRDDTRRLSCGDNIDRANARMRMGAAKKCDVAGIRRIEIVGVASPAFDEPLRVPPRRAAADPIAAVRHGFGSEGRVATASIASTIA
jgi:hypothetical protein